MIGFAILNYESRYNHLPTTNRDPSGKPLLSWRVAILQYVEEDPLYKEFHLDEAWDSPHNLALLPRMPRIYKSVGEQPPGPNMTFYRSFTGPGTAFERDGLLLAKDFPNGTENTILVIEAGEAVPWTKPDELEYQRDQPLPALGGIFRATTWLDRMRGKYDGFNVLFANGSMQFFPRNTDEAELRRMIVRTSP